MVEFELDLPLEFSPSLFRLCVRQRAQPLGGLPR